MVTIINGEIVADDDPRAMEYRRRKNNTSQRTNNSSDQNAAARTQQSPQQVNQRNGGNSSIFYEINNRLLDAGFPRVNLAGRVFEPAMIVIVVVLGGFVFGFRVVFVAVLIYFIAQSMARHAGGNRRH